MDFLNIKKNELKQIALSKKKEYINAVPFPHIVLDNFFKDSILDLVLKEFPNNLDEVGYQFKTKVEQKKYTLNKGSLLSDETNNFINFLNSQIFLEFIQELTSIKEKLQADPYLEGGGLHELRNDGFLNIHADFNKHPSLNLDRRLNILIYLNKNWEEEFGGNLELWDKNMTACKKCSVGESRKSIAMYYYSNGRPAYEKKLGNHSTIFRKRPGTNDPDGNVEFKKIFGKLYYRNKKKI